MDQDSKLPNVALVSLEVLVNTSDLRQTVKELTERCATHPTTVDMLVTPKFVPVSVVSAVEDGTYKPGQFVQTIITSRTNENGDDVFERIDF